MVWVVPLAMMRLPVGGGEAGREVMRQAVGFLGALNWGTLPLFLYMTFRRYLQAFNHVRPIAAAVVSANLVNAGLDWLLLFGHRFHVGGLSAGIPAYGVVGAAVSTALARVYLAAFVGAAVWWVDRRHGYGLRGRNECWIGRGYGSWSAWGSGGRADLCGDCDLCDGDGADWGDGSGATGGA